MRTLLRRVTHFIQLPQRERRRRLVRKLLGRHLSKRSGGILHIGAHEAGEAETYGDRAVIWFEANPDLMPALNRRLTAFPNQRAFCVLLGDRRDEVDFNVSSNRGESSSIFAFGPYSSGPDSIWPELDLRTEKTIRLEMQTLDAFLQEHHIDSKRYDHWVLDVQGAELLVLKGAALCLSCCLVITTEISTVPIYEGGVRYSELKDALSAAGFVSFDDPDRMGMRHGDLTFMHRSLIESSAYLRLLLALLPR